MEVRHLKDVWQLMQRNRYKFPASIEYEYQTPEGADVLIEIACVRCQAGTISFCRQVFSNGGSVGGKMK